MILDIEKSFIGCLILMQDLRLEACQKAFGIVKPSSFESRPHRITFEAIKHFDKIDQRVDLLVLADYMEKKGTLDDAGGFFCLNRVSAALGQATDAK